MEGAAARQKLALPAVFLFTSRMNTLARLYQAAPDGAPEQGTSPQAAWNYRRTGAETQSRSYRRLAQPVFGMSQTLGR